MHSGQWAMEVGGGLADDGLRMESEATASHPTLPVEGAVGVGGSRDSVGGLDIGSSGEDVPPYHSPRQQQVSLQEYNRQAGDYTAEAIRQLKASPEYKTHTQRCLSCGCAWCDGEASDSCVECGGFAMYRPCPLCHGECGALWTRSVDMSRSFHKDHWYGDCSMSGLEEHWRAQLLHTVVEPDDNELTDAMQDLSTH